MKIAIIGTRGIPNNYGGFEQLAECLSLGLKEKGHEVYVYSSHTHKYQDKSWNGIHIIHKYDPERKIGTAGQFIYDFNCIVDSRKRNFDVILNLGYTSSSIWMGLFPKRPTIITNMDGMEWKRSKYSKRVQGFLKHAEKLAVKKSDILVADSLAIKSYLKNTYQVDAHFIAYGSELFDKPDNTVLQAFKVKPFEYYMLIARMEPENNIEMILDGFTKSGSKKQFFVVGNIKNKFGAYIAAKFANDARISFTGPIYQAAIINNLRYYSFLYFHGHSVGGTNPSLLEAMGCQSLIAAHNNEFNQSVLGPDAYYFGTADEVCALVNKGNDLSDKGFRAHNFEKIKNEYSWSKIVNSYENIMLK